jgi:hypothetical protein
MKETGTKCREKATEVEEEWGVEEKQEEAAETKGVQIVT